MQFWDSSALLPLVVRQPPFSAACRAIARTAAPQAVAFLARVECRSAIERLARAGILSATAGRRALAAIDDVLSRCDIVAFSTEVETEAVVLLARHPLRALDALQLACARRLARVPEELPTLVCCDRRLAAAAAHERYPLAVTLPPTFPERGRIA